MTHWVLGEFDSPATLLEAVKTLRGEHIRELDTHTPEAVPGLEHAIGVPETSLAGPAFIAGLAGAALTSAALWWTNAPAAWRPAAALVPLALAALGVAVAFVTRFARLRHPVFQHEPFVKGASTTGFWLSVNTRVPEDAEHAKARLELLGAKNVAIVTDLPLPRRGEGRGEGAER